MKIKPTDNVLHAWIKSYVPAKDLFFLTKEYLHNEIDLTEVLLDPKELLEKMNSYTPDHAVKWA